MKLGGGGTALDESQLLSIAGDKSRVFIVCDFSRLDKELHSALTQSICNEVDTGCRESKADIIFLVDSSGSIGAQNFTDLKGTLVPYPPVSLDWALRTCVVEASFN